jgi:circadian clock protein KaiC
MTPRDRLDAAAAPASPARAATGIAGLDDVLGGGLPKGSTYVVQGEPGTGKTTLGLQFLRHGQDHGEPGVYLALAHSTTEIEAIAASHGWDLAGIAIHEFAPGGAFDRVELEQTVFSPDDLEAGSLSDALVEALRSSGARRVVIDALDQLRLVSDRPQRYRRQLVLVTRALDRLGDATTLLLTDVPATAHDRELDGMVRGVVRLTRRTTAHGGQSRHLEVIKARGLAYDAGRHPFRIATGGLEVFGRAKGGTATTDPPPWRPASSGVPELDTMLGGGLEYGTTVLVAGTTGTGTSSLTLQYAAAAAARGERAVVFLTDERAAVYLRRAADLGHSVADLVVAERLAVRAVDPAAALPEALVEDIRGEVTSGGATVIVIDSLTGYLEALADDAATTLWRGLFAFLTDRGVLTLVVMREAGLVEGTGRLVPLDVSHLVDTIVRLRRHETGNDGGRSVQVVKKRLGPHDHAPRALLIGPGGVSVGACTALPAATRAGGGTLSAARDGP